MSGEVSPAAAAPDDAAVAAGAAGVGVGLTRKRCSTRRAMLGLMGEPPARTSWMPAVMRAGSASFKRYPVAPASIEAITCRSSANMVQTSTSHCGWCGRRADHLDAVDVGQAQVDQHHVGHLRIEHRDAGAAGGHHPDQPQQRIGQHRVGETGA